MKKLLLSVLLFISANTLLANIYVGVGVDSIIAESDIQYKNRNINDSGTNINFTPYIELSKNISKNTEIGIGYSYSQEKSTEVDSIYSYEIINNDFYYRAEKSEMPKIESNTLYLVHKYTITDYNNVKIYTKAMFGYSFNSCDSNMRYTRTYGKNEHKDKRYHQFKNVDISNGLYYGIGMGSEFNNLYTIELIYELKNANLYFDDTKTKYNKEKLKVSFGIKL